MQIDNRPAFRKINDLTTVYGGEIQDSGEPIDRKEVAAIKRLNATGNKEFNTLVSNAKDTTNYDNSPPKAVLQRPSAIYTLYKPELIKENEGWLKYNSGSLEFQTKYDIFAITYTMISGFSKNLRLATRLVMDDLPQITSRTIQGYIDHPSTTSAFVSQLEWGSHKIDTQYKASKKFSINDKKEDENFSTGIILIPHKKLYMKKIINTAEHQLFNDNTWADFQTLSEVVTLERTSKVLVMYNISLPGMQSHIVTKIDINTVPIKVKIKNMTFI